MLSHNSPKGKRRKKKVAETCTVENIPTTLIQKEPLSPEETQEPKHNPFPFHVLACALRYYLDSTSKRNLPAGVERKDWEIIIRSDRLEGWVSIHLQNPPKPKCTEGAISTSHFPALLSIKKLNLNPAAPWFSIQKQPFKHPQEKTTNPTSSSARNIFSFPSFLAQSCSQRDGAIGAKRL